MHPTLSFTWPLWAKLSSLYLQGNILASKLCLWHLQLCFEWQCGKVLAWQNKTKQKLRSTWHECYMSLRFESQLQTQMSYSICLGISPSWHCRCRHYDRRQTCFSLCALSPFPGTHTTCQILDFLALLLFKKTVGRPSTCCLPAIQEMNIIPYGLFSTHPHGPRHKQWILWQLGQVPLGWLLCLEMTQLFFFLNLHYIFIAHIQN